MKAITEPLTVTSDDGRPTVKMAWSDFITKKSINRETILEHYSFRVAPWGILAWFATGAGAYGTTMDLRTMDPHSWSAWLGVLMDLVGTAFFAVIAYRATTAKYTKAMDEPLVLE